MERKVFRCPNCNRKYDPSAAESVDYLCEECEVSLVSDFEEVPDVGA